jgi:hypothetical protein
VSDTPRTDAKAQFFGFNPEEGEEFVHVDFARELERENAALKADKELLDSNMIWLTVYGQPVWFNGFDLRKAIRRAMKEAGDDDIMRQHLNEGGTPT